MKCNDFRGWCIVIGKNESFMKTVKFLIISFSFLIILILWARPDPLNNQATTFTTAHMGGPGDHRPEEPLKGNSQSKQGGSIVIHIVDDI